LKYNKQAKKNWHACNKPFPYSVQSLINQKVEKENTLKYNETKRKIKRALGHGMRAMKGNKMPCLFLMLNSSRMSLFFSCR
jgi:hypothetical protein